MSKEEKGIRHNKNKLRWRNFPKFLFRPVVEVGSWAEKREGNPNGKYETLNFLKGLSVLDTLDSLDRHADKLSDPKISDYDEETGLHHLAHIAWNALVALHYIDTEHDDRELTCKEKEDKETILPGGIKVIEDPTLEDMAWELRRTYTNLTQPKIPTHFFKDDDD